MNNNLTKAEIEQIVSEIIENQIETARNVASSEALSVSKQITNEWYIRNADVLSQYGLRDFTNENNETELNFRVYSQKRDTVIVERLNVDNSNIRQNDLAPGTKLVFPDDLEKNADYKDLSDIAMNLCLERSDVIPNLDSVQLYNNVKTSLWKETLENSFSKVGINFFKNVQQSLETEENSMDDISSKIELAKDVFNNIHRLELDLETKCYKGVTKDGKNLLISPENEYSFLYGALANAKLEMITNNLYQDISLEDVTTVLKNPNDLDENLKLDPEKAKPLNVKSTDIKDLKSDIESKSELEEEIVKENKSQELVDKQREIIGNYKFDLKKATLFGYIGTAIKAMLNFKNIKQGFKLMRSGFSNYEFNIEKDVEELKRVVKMFDKKESNIKSDDVKQTTTVENEENKKSDDNYSNDEIKENNQILGIEDNIIERENENKKLDDNHLNDESKENMQEDLENSYENMSREELIQQNKEKDLEIKRIQDLSPEELEEMANKKRYAKKMEEQQDLMLKKYVIKNAEQQYDINDYNKARVTKDLEQYLSQNDLSLEEYELGRSLTEEEKEQQNKQEIRKNEAIQNLSMIPDYLDRYAAMETLNKTENLGITPEEIQSYENVLADDIEGKTR